MRIKKIRKLLEKNKIFFEIITTVALVFIAIQANNISQNQMRIEKKKSQPSFAIEYRDNYLTINHNSGTFSNLRCSIVSTILASVENGNNENGHDVKELFIIENSIWDFVPQINESIELKLITAKDSIFKEAEELHFNSINPNPKEFWATVFQLRTYIRFMYNDFEGEPQKEYYTLVNGKGFKISPNKGDLLFDLTGHAMLSLDKLNAIWFKEPDNLKNVELVLDK